MSDAKLSVRRSEASLSGLARAEAATLELQTLLADELFPPVLRILLFGSQARGDAGPDSDTDIGVVFQTPPSDTREREDLCLRVHALRKRLLNGEKAVQVAALFESELASPNDSSSPSFLRNVLRDAVPLTADPEEGRSFAALSSLKGRKAIRKRKASAERFEAARRHLGVARRQRTRSQVDMEFSLLDAQYYAMTSALAACGADPEHSKRDRLARQFERVVVDPGHIPADAWKMLNSDWEAQRKPRPWHDLAATAFILEELLRAIQAELVPHAPAMRRRHVLPSPLGKDVEEKRFLTENGTSILDLRISDLDTEDHMLAVVDWARRSSTWTLQWIDWDGGFIRATIPSAVHVERVLALAAVLTAATHKHYGDVRQATVPVLGHLVLNDEVDHEMSPDAAFTVADKGPLPRLNNLFVDVGGAGDAFKPAIAAFASPAADELWLFEDGFLPYIQDLQSGEEFARGRQSRLLRGIKPQLFETTYRRFVAQGWLNEVKVECDADRYAVLSFPAEFRQKVVFTMNDYPM